MVISYAAPLLLRSARTRYKLMAIIIAPTSVRDRWNGGRAAVSRVGMRARVPTVALCSLSRASLARHDTRLAYCEGACAMTGAASPQ